jgi:hypothetical protein
MTSDYFWSIDYLMGRWHPTIGDPTFMGWLTVVAYFAGAFLTFMTAYHARVYDRRAFLFWWISGVLLTLLGINKQLDLQSLFTEIGRQVAKEQGWYGQRREFQFGFVEVFTAIALGSFAVLAIKMRTLFRRFALAFTGIFFLVSFIIIRAASFHHVDKVLGTWFLGAKINWILELGGILIIIIAAIKERCNETKKHACHGA